MIRVVGFVCDNINYNSEDFDYMNAEKVLEAFLNQIGEDNIIQIIPIVKGRTDSSLYDPHGYTVIYRDNSK